MPRMFALILAVGFFSGAVHAEVYTWTDASGVAHFSDSPPGERPHQKLVISAPSTMPMAENLLRGRNVSEMREDVRKLLSAPARGAREARERAGTDKARAQSARACNAYREKLDRIQSKLRAGYGNDKGNTLRRQRRETSQKLSRECLLR